MYSKGNAGSGCARQKGSTLWFKYLNTMNKEQFKRNDEFSSSCGQCDVLLVVEFSFVFKRQCKVRRCKSNGQIACFSCQNCFIIFIGIDPILVFEVS